MTTTAGEARGERYSAIILKVSTGEIRTYHMGDILWNEGSLYWWSDGNFGCDCNRCLEFERAGGREPGDDECECGEDGYKVQLVSESGTILYDELPATQPTAKEGEG